LSYAEPCQNGAQCVDQLADYKCICSAGFSGHDCERDIDECASNPCMNGATCFDYVNSFVCRCSPGFSGVHCHINDDDCTARWTYLSGIPVISHLYTCDAMTWASVPFLGFVCNHMPYILSSTLYSHFPHPHHLPLFTFPQFFFYSFPFPTTLPFSSFLFFSMFSVLPLTPFPLEIFCRIQFGMVWAFHWVKISFQALNFAFPRDVQWAFCVTRHMCTGMSTLMSYWSGSTSPFISVSILPTLMSSFLRISHNFPHYIQS